MESDIGDDLRFLKEESEDDTDTLLLPVVAFLFFHIDIDDSLLSLYQYNSGFIHESATLLLK